MQKWNIVPMLFNVGPELKHHNIRTTAYLLGICLLRIRHMHTDSAQGMLEIGRSIAIYYTNFRFIFNIYFLSTTNITEQI